MIKNDLHIAFHNDYTELLQNEMIDGTIVDTDAFLDMFAQQVHSEFATNITKILSYLLKKILVEKLEVFKDMVEVSSFLQSNRELIDEVGDGITSSIDDMTVAISQLSAAKILNYTIAFPERFKEESASDLQAIVTNLGGFYANKVADIYSRVEEGVSVVELNELGSSLQQLHLLETLGYEIPVPSPTDLDDSEQPEDVEDSETVDDSFGDDSEVTDTSDDSCDGSCSPR